MISFAVRWLPFDGGDEYILPEFGVDPTEFYRRLRTLLATPRVCEVDAVTRAALIDLCHRKGPADWSSGGTGHEG